MAASQFLAAVGSIVSNNAARTARHVADQLVAVLALERFEHEAADRLRVGLQVLAEGGRGEIGRDDRRHATGLAAARADGLGRAAERSLIDAIEFRRTWEPREPDARESGAAEILLGAAVLVDPGLHESETERRALEFFGSCNLGHVTPSCGVADKSRPVALTTGRGALRSLLRFQYFGRVIPRLRARRLRLGAGGALGDDDGDLAALGINLDALPACGLSGAHGTRKLALTESILGTGWTRLHKESSRSAPTGARGCDSLECRVASHGRNPSPPNWRFRICATNLRDAFILVNNAHNPKM